ncbi:hypothetical protein EV579_0671 [Bacillus sp. BK450]|nr:hypothetical protein EV579_0671 [Bacillus sp. BK450]
MNPSPEPQTFPTSSTKVVLALVNKLTSPMAFSILMCGLMYLLTKDWSQSLDVTSQTIAFWLWFASVFFVNLVGMYALVKEAKHAYGEMGSGSS